MKHNPKKTNRQPAGSSASATELAELRRRVAELEALQLKHSETEAILAHERNLLRTLIDNLPDYIYFKDTASRFLIANRAVAQLAGVATPDELVGKTDFDFFPKPLATKYYTDEQAIIASGQALINRAEPMQNQQTDEPGWLFTTKVPLRDSQGQIVGVVGMGRNITEWKQAEEALRESKEQILNLLNNMEELVEARTAELTTANAQLHQEIAERERVEAALRESESKYRLLMEQAADGIFIADQQGNLLEVNPRGCQMLGYPLAHLLRLNFFTDLIPAAELEIIPLHLDDVLAGKTILTERKLYCRDGSLLPVEISAKMLADGRLQAIIRDITERRQVQESLQRFAERLQTLQELDRAILSAQSPAAIAQAALHHMQRLVPFRQAAVVAFDFDTYEAVMLAAYMQGQAHVMVNQHAPLDMFGIAEELRQGSVKTPEKILTLTPPPLALQTLPPEGICCYINVPLVAKGQLIGSLNLGTHTPGIFTAEHVEIASEVADPLAVAIQQARLHEQIQQHAAELEERVIERTAKLEEINNELHFFSFSVSHDLRAPLRAVQGFAGALLEDFGPSLDPLGQDYAQRIVDAAERMEGLIQDLLVYSRLSRSDLRLQPVALAAIIADGLTQLEIPIREQQAQIKVEAPLPRVIGHYATLVQLVSNLLSNAIKFVAPGVQPQIRIWSELLPENRMRLWLQDNGIGIQPEYWERIFQIFERLHGIEAYPGTGVGLAIVRKGAIRMGGNAGLDSSPGQGSRFWIELRRAE